MYYCGPLPEINDAIPEPMPEPAKPGTVPAHYYRRHSSGCNVF